MSVSRRGFLRWSTVVWALTRLFPVRAAVPAVNPASDPTLGAWLDTLIPADETPSATQLGVDRMMLAAERNDPDYRIVLDFGRKWLDAQARTRGATDFADLDTAGREAVAARAAAAGDAPEYHFFLSTRQEAFAFYYVQPESWPGLGYRGPPQPLGHMDYARKPGHGIDG
jgi:hypothetical protein